MDGTDPLSQLADIHLPEPVGFWPPAPGWWVLFVLLSVITYFTAKRLYALWRVRRTCRFAIIELEKCMTALRSSAADNAAKLDFVNEINAVLRRVALKNFPSEPVANLGGSQWIAFLRTHGDAQLLSEPLAATLSQGRFAQQWDVDSDGLYRMAHQWISSLYLAKIPATSASTSSTTAVTEHA